MLASTLAGSEPSITSFLRRIILEFYRVSVCFLHPPDHSTNWYSLEILKTLGGLFLPPASCQTYRSMLDTCRKKWVDRHGICSKEQNEVASRLRRCYYLWDTYPTNKWREPHSDCKIVSQSQKENRPVLTILRHKNSSSCTSSAARILTALCGGPKHTTKCHSHEFGDSKALVCLTLEDITPCVVFLRAAESLQFHTWHACG